jgi:hypothetical protein
MLVLAGCGSGGPSSAGGSASLSIDSIQACLERAGFQTDRGTGGLLAVVTSGGKPPTEKPPDILVGPPNMPTARVVVFHDPTIGQALELLGGQRTARNVVVVPAKTNSETFKEVAPGVRASDKRPSLSQVPGVEKIRACASAS